MLSLHHIPAAQLNTWISTSAVNWLLTFAQVLTGLSVVFCLVRAIPVVWEGRRYLAAPETAPKAAAVPAVVR